MIHQLRIDGDGIIAHELAQVVLELWQASDLDAVHLNHGMNSRAHDLSKIYQSYHNYP